MSCNLSEYVWERGYQIGLQIGEKALGELVSILLAEGELENVKLAVTDEEARKEFYKKYGIIEK